MRKPRFRKHLSEVAEIVDLTLGLLRMRPRTFAEHVGVHEGSVSRLLNGKTESLARSSVFVQRCQELIDSALAAGEIEESFVRELFGTVKLSQFRLDEEGLSLPSLAARERVMAHLEGIQAGLRDAHTFSQRLAHRWTWDLVRCAAAARHQHHDASLDELVYRVATRFIVVVNSYPPVAGAYWHSRLATLGRLVVRLLDRQEDEVTFKLGWATALAYNAAGRFEESEVVLSDIAAKADGLETQFAAVVTTDHARLLNDMGRPLKAIESAVQSLNFAMRCGDPFRMFTSKHAEAIARCLLGRTEEARRCVSEEAFRTLGVYDRDVPRKDILSVQLNRELFAAIEQPSEAGRGALRSLAADHLREATDPKFPLTAVAASRRRFIAILERDRPAEEVLQDALVFRTRGILPPGLSVPKV